MMRLSIGACVAGLMLALVAGFPAAHADGADELAISAIVEDQVKALGEGDAKRAFSYATPDIQSRFGSSETFLRMVKQSYAALIRPAAFEIEDVRTDGASGAVRATVTARDGQRFDALYPVKRQPDGKWRIDGCYLQPAKGRAL